MKPICIILLSAIFFASCKKEETVAPTSTTTPTTTVSNGTTTHDALFEILKNCSKSNGVIVPISGMNCKAYLCAQPIVNEAAYNQLDIGTVSLNGVQFKKGYSILSYLYSDTTLSAYTPPYIWNVSGSSNFNALIDTCTTTFPTFTGGLSLPDSISKSAGVTFPITGLSGCNFFKVVLFGPSGSQSISPKILAGNTTSVVYTASELSGLTTGNYATFIVYFMKDNVKIINGKRVNFRAGVAYLVLNFKIVS